MIGDLRSSGRIVRHCCRAQIILAGIPDRKAVRASPFCCVSRGKSGMYDIVLYMPDLFFTNVVHLLFAAGIVILDCDRYNM